MAANERKKRIMEHLALTGNLNFKRRSSGFKPEALKGRQPPSSLDRSRG